MTDDVIRLARKAGFAHGIGCFAAVEEDIVAFAKLVAEHERQRIANQIDRMPFGDTAASFAIWIREGAP